MSLNSQILLNIPGIEGEEMMLIINQIQNLPEEKQMLFLNVYRSRRKDPQTILIMILIGFLGIGGIHRFFLNHIGMGILYLLTMGVCYIGTIIDLVNYKKITLEFNQAQILETSRLI